MAFAPRVKLKTRLLGGGMEVMKTGLVCLYCMISVISVMSAKIIQVPGDFKTIQEGAIVFGLK